MKLISRWVIDTAAIMAVGWLALPHGWGWALTAGVLVSVYSCWSYMDGMESK